MKYFKKIIGEKIYLSPINPDDAELYTKWLNDFEVSGYLGYYPQMISIAGERQSLEKAATEGQQYAIVLSEGDVLLGNVGLREIDHRSRRATVSIFIGEAQYRGSGYGTQAMRLILGYAFKTLNIQNVLLLAQSDNERALASYRKVGFREIGRRRRGTFKDGRYIDMVYMDILDTDFYADEK